MTGPRLLALSLALGPLLGLAACTPRPDDPAAPGGTAGEAETPTLVRVERIDVAVLKSFPVQIHANLSGHLSDGCVELAEAEVRREGSTFTIALPASRPAGRMCAQALMPFQRTVPVPVRDLPKGRYEILSHGASASFTLDRDNSFNPR